MSLKPTRAINTNMRDYILGSDVYADYYLFDETKTYVADEFALWKGKLYVVKSGQTSTPNPKGIFTYNPQTQSSVWEPYEGEFLSGFAYNASGSTTINNSDVVLAIDTIGQDNGMITSLSSGEIEISSNKLCLLSMSVSYDETAGNSRSQIRSWVEGYDGSNWVTIPGTTVYTYHRQNSQGEDSGSSTVLVDCNNYEKFRLVGRMYTGSGTIVTTSNGNVLLLIELVGARGVQGLPGPQGADGDMTWEGAWVNQDYTANQAVEYQGSSYVCHTNTTAKQVPTDTNFWDLLAQKGADGSGATLNIQQDGSNITNTPHSTLNFTNWLSAEDSGGGVATIKFVDKPLIIYGATGDQTLTSNTTWTAIDLNSDINTDPSLISRSGNRLYAQDDLWLKVSYNIFMYLDSGDSARNTMVAGIRLNGSSIINYTQSGCYARGYNYSKHANCTIAPTYMTLTNGDYIELVYMASDDYQSPHIGNNQTWITLEVI